MANKIFIVEDDENLSNLVGDYLKKYNYDIVICDDFKNIVELVKSNHPDLILLDINIPYYDGFYWCQEIRKSTVAPIIFMSARSEDYDQIRAIVSGGDDYIVKPFSYELLMAKINSQFRRIFGEYSQKDNFVIIRGNCKLDTKRLTLECNHKIIDLSKNESILLELLFSNFPNVVRRDKILTEIWDTDAFVEENTLNVAISRVRKKLTDLDANLQVATVRMLGYKLENI